MTNNQEQLRITVPKNNEWHTAEVEKKAEAMGMEKGDFMFKALDMFMNFDEVFLNEIKRYAAGLKIPEYMVIQNITIARMAEKQGEAEACLELGIDPPKHIIYEFMQVSDKDGYRTLTGEELLNVLKDKAKRAKLQELNEVLERRAAL